MNFRRTRAVGRKELLHIIRDPQSLGAALALPLLMLLIFGYALSLDVDHIPTAVYDLDHTPESRDLIRDFSGSRYFDVVEQVQSYKPIERGMDQRKIVLGLAVPPGFARSLLSGREADVQLLFDGTDSNTAAIAAGYAESIVAAHAQRLRNDAMNRNGRQPLPAPVDARIRVWYNPDLVSRNYIVPGLIAVILMIIATLLPSLTIAREWENGTMEQLLSTPVRPVELVLGKLSAYFLLGMVNMLICILIGLYAFHVPMKGSTVLLFFSSCAFLFGALCWGLFISAAMRSQLLAYQMGTLTSFLPAFLLSGFIYEIDTMPRVIQFFALFVPARYFINIVKGVFLKGTGLRLMWFDMLLLIAYGTLVFIAATRKMRQKVA